MFSVAKMEVKVICQTSIKPSSPTPPGLKIYNISLLDQFAPGNDIPMIFFYSTSSGSSYLNISETSLLLKQSLSETLTHYYPLAGRIKDSVSVDCNDEGVCYVEAQANISLSDYLTQPDLVSLNKLLPAMSNWREMDSSSVSYLTLIQHTVFSCGSFAIGVFVSHKIMDGTSIASFLKCWASVARKGSYPTTGPFLDVPSMFPCYEGFPTDSNMVAVTGPFCKPGKFSARRFVFDASAIDNLKAQATTSALQNPTRVEALSSFLLECINSILNQRSSDDKPNALMMAVNLRQRAAPPISETSVGNFFWLAHTLCSSEETRLTSLVCKLREAIRKIDSEFVKDLRNGGFDKLSKSTKGIESDLKSSRTMANGVNFMLMSSWCNFGLYEIDFGWGKPKWVTCATSSEAESVTPMLNLFILMDAGERDKGVEAWVYMDEGDLVLLEKHQHLLQYASVNPSPLK